jgi:hypothetical protein
MSTPNVTSGSHVDDVLLVDNTRHMTSARNSVYTQLKVQIDFEMGTNVHD